MTRLKDRFDLVIFDWAGTMVDFGCEAPVKALIEAFGAEGVVIDAATARRDMGKAKSDHVRSLLLEPTVAAAWLSYHGRTANDGDVEVLIARLGPLMRDYAARASTLIPGAREVVDRLRAAGLRVEYCCLLLLYRGEEVLHGFGAISRFWRRTRGA